MLKSRIICFFLFFPLAIALQAQSNSDTKIVMGGNEYFSVVSLDYQVNGDAIQLVENNGNINYITPRLELSAKVNCLNEEITRKWKIGFVQILTEARLRQDYSDGYTEWKWPTLPVSDSNGSEFPWYGGSRGYAYGYGAPNLGMNDNFNINVSWNEPLPPNGTQVSPQSFLTKIDRFQKFHVLLCALDEEENVLYVLSQLEWQCEFTIDSDCSRPIGSRASASAFNIDVDKEMELDEVPVEWILSPVANDAQEFWSSKSDVPLIRRK